MQFFQAGLGWDAARRDFGAAAPSLLGAWSGRRLPARPPVPPRLPNHAAPAAPPGFLLQFIIATIPTVLGVNESGRLARALRKEGIPCRRIVVNQIIGPGMGAK